MPGVVRLLGGLAAAVLLVLAAASAGISAAPERAGYVLITAVGDIAMAPSPDGGAGFFRRVRRGLNGDVVLGNLEGTLATRGASKCGPATTDCFAFRAPPSYARVLRRAGFTVLNLANNHALDFGPSAQDETVAALDRGHLLHTGRPDEVAFARAGETTIAVLGFAPYSWAEDLRDLPRVRRVVRAAAGLADLVVVTMHAGREGRDADHVERVVETYLEEARGNVVAFAHAAVEAGADLVVGHGPHVLRGMEWYRGRLIAYSLGNFLGNGTLSISGTLGVSGILRVRLRPDGSWEGGSLLPVRLVPPGVPSFDSSRAAVGLVARLSREDFGRRAVRLSEAGALRPPG